MTQLEPDGHWHVAELCGILVIEARPHGRWNMRKSMMRLELDGKKR